MNGEPEQLCPHPLCGHETVRHQIIATSTQPELGGFIVCKIKRCPCVRLWGVCGRRPAVVPDPVTVALMQAVYQDRAGGDGARLLPMGVVGLHAEYLSE